MNLGLLLETKGYLFLTFILYGCSQRYMGLTSELGKQNNITSLRYLATPTSRWVVDNLLPDHVEKFTGQRKSLNFLYLCLCLLNFGDDVAALKSLLKLNRNNERKRLESIIKGEYDNALVVEDLLPVELPPCP